MIPGWWGSGAVGSGEVGSGALGSGALVAGLVVAALSGAAVLVGGAAPPGTRSDAPSDNSSADRAGPAGFSGAAPGPKGRWRERTRREPAPPLPDVALLCDLVAAAVTAGLPPGRALEAALDALAVEGYAEDPELRRAAVQLAWGTGPENVVQELARDRRAPWRDLAEPLLLSSRTGAAAAGLLVSAASSVRARRRWEAEAAAARLSASLVLPLGLCTLPAFLLLGVVPVVLSMATELLG